ncbi:MAG: FHA domain-containing protein, partial [Ramlibacter sp.]|nr:FHA domain-containing protein [Cryobacterium sp.]
MIGLVIGSPGRSVPWAEALQSGRDFGLGAVLAHTLFWSLADSAQSDESTIIRAPRADATAESDTVLRRPPGSDTAIPPSAAVHATGSREARTAPADRPRCAFRLPGGEEIRLDTACHLGRRPRPPRIPRVVPVRLVTVSSPTSAVSGTHLEIKQEGESVVVTDLGSTNGTIVTAPRARAARLRPGES